MNLKEIAFKYGTDKKHTKHNFVRNYEFLFESIRNEPIKLLEIGVYLCRSHNTWVDYFPNAIIYGIDIADHRNRYKRNRLILDVVDQGNKEQLKEYAERNGPWNYIIDDGSHMSSHQRLSFEVLWPYVSPGGYYFIEDTQSSYWDKYKEESETLMESMLKLTDHICRVPYYKGYYSGIHLRRENEKLDLYQDTIETITFRPGMVIIKKYDEAYPKL